MDQAGIPVQYSSHGAVEFANDDNAVEQDTLDPVPGIEELQRASSLTIVQQGNEQAAVVQKARVRRLPGQYQVRQALLDGHYREVRGELDMDQEPLSKWPAEELKRMETADAMFVASKARIKGAGGLLKSLSLKTNPVQVRGQPNSGLRKTSALSRCKSMKITRFYRTSKVPRTEKGWVRLKAKRTDSNSDEDQEWQDNSRCLYAVEHLLSEPTSLETRRLCQAIDDAAVAELVKYFVTMVKGKRSVEELSQFLDELERSTDQPLNGLLKDRFERSPLHLLVTPQGTVREVEDRLLVMRWYMDRLGKEEPEALITLKNNNGATVLITAANFADALYMPLWLELLKLCSMNTLLLTSKAGFTAFHMLSTKGHRAALEAALSRLRETVEEHNLNCVNCRKRANPGGQGPQEQPPQLKDITKLLHHLNERDPVKYNGALLEELCRKYGCWRD